MNAMMWLLAVSTLSQAPQSPRFKTAAYDAQHPAPLPIQAKYTPDRAPLTDATQEASTQAALATKPTVRITIAPQLPTPLVDPNENAQAIRMDPLGEPGLPVVQTPRPMGK